MIHKIKPQYKIVHYPGLLVVIFRRGLYRETLVDNLRRLSVLLEFGEFKMRQKHADLFESSCYGLLYMYMDEFQLDRTIQVYWLYTHDFPINHWSENQRENSI